MRHHVFIAVTALTFAAPAFAGPPLDGDYQTTDMGGVINIGHYTEGWSGGGGAVLPGTTLNAESWNGSALGTEWRYWCATEMAPAVVLVDNVNASGNGNRTYMKTFMGGYVWLSGTGPWANGDPDYPGTITNYTEFETVQYSNWVPVGAVTNVQATAHFDNYPSMCLVFQVSNGTRIGTTDLGQVKPVDYPAFLETDCAPTRTLGAWWDMTQMTLSISGCATSVQERTWGAVKAGYR